MYVNFRQHNNIERLHKTVIYEHELKATVCEHYLRIKSMV